MATLHLTAATTVADFRKEFNEAFGSQVKVYIGNKGADTSTTLSQAGLTKSGEMECANTMTVDTFIAACKNDWGLKVKVYTCDEWVAALDALTLEQSGQVKKAATKADMEKMVRTPAVEVPSTSVQTDAQPTIKIKNEEISNENIADLEKLINKDMVYVDSTILDTNCTYIMTKYYDASFHPNDDKRRKLVEWSDAKDMDVPLCLKCKIDEFLISKYLVSQKLWQLVMGNNPSSIIGDDYPVNNVSLIDAQSFVDKLNQMTD